MVWCSGAKFWCCGILKRKKNLTHYFSWDTTWFNSFASYFWTFKNTLIRFRYSSVWKTQKYFIKRYKDTTYLFRCIFIQTHFFLPRSKLHKYNWCNCWGDNSVVKVLVASKRSVLQLTTSLVEVSAMPPFLFVNMFFIQCSKNWKIVQIK